MKAKFATPYNVTDERNKSFGTTNDEATMTQVSDQSDTDINIIMQRYAKTGQLPQLIEQGKYGDFSEVGDFRAATDAIHQANTMFAAVPAQIRKRFDNDPAQFLEFVNNPENLDEMRKLGLANPLPDPSTVTDEEREEAHRRNQPRYDDQHGTEPVNNRTNDNGNGHENRNTERPAGRTERQPAGPAGSLPRGR